MCWPRERPANRMPPVERQHEGLGGLGDCFAVGLGAVAGAWVDHRSGQTRMPPQERRHEGFLVWGIVPHARSLGTTQRGGALLLFVLRVVAGACVGGSGQPRMPPRERQHEGLGGIGGFFHTPGAWERHRFNGGAVAVCFEGCCGGMCWPQERPATHAAAGAAARGVRGGLGDFFTCLELGNDTEGRGAVAVCSEGGCGGMCWPVDRPATHAAAGAAAPRPAAGQARRFLV